MHTASFEVPLPMSNLQDPHLSIVTHLSPFKNVLSGHVHPSTGGSWQFWSAVGLSHVLVHDIADLYTSPPSHFNAKS